MSPVFDAYARYYDLLYKDKNYAAETDFVISRIRNYVPVGAEILDLGCGTGVHAGHLARLGYRVEGVDLSAEMLEKAHARKANMSADIAHRVSFRQGDVRSVRTGKKYDAVLSLFHVMSYQNSDADLVAALATAAAHLKTGGVFMFDFWYGPAVLSQQPEKRTLHLEDETVSVERVAVPVMRPQEHIVDVKYAVAITVKATGEELRINETHSMRYLFPDDIERLIEAAGWRHCASGAWMKDAPLSEGDWSGFTLLQRQ